MGVFVLQGPRWAALALHWPIAGRGDVLMALVSTLPASQKGVADNWNERKGAHAAVDKSFKALLVVLYGCGFLAGFNENLVNMALATVMVQLKVDAVTAQWLVTGYMIVVAVVVACMAYLYRRLSRRRLFFLGSVLGIAGSFGGLVAPNFGFLLVARLVQAAGTGVFIPLMMNVIVDTVPHEKIGSYLAIGSSMITIGPATAPIVTGFLVSELGWRSVFLVPLVAGVVLLAAGIFVVRGGGQPQRGKLDGVSVALMAIAVTLLSMGLSAIALQPLAALAELAGAAGALVLFVRRQLRRARPLVSLDPLRFSFFWPAAILVMVTMMTYFSLSVVTPLYFEEALEVSASMAGLMLLLPVCAHAAAAVVSGRLLDKRGEWPLLPIGFVLTLVGVLLAVFGALWPSAAVVIGGIALGYLGTGMLLSPSQSAGLRRLPLHLNPHGVSLMGMALQSAACLGPALYVGIMSAVADAAESSGVVAQAAIGEGFAAAMAVAAAICTGGLVAALVYASKMRRRPYEAEGIQE